MPDADTSWEAIKDWRADSQARSSFDRLRLWMSRSSESSSSISTLKEEMEVLLDDYSNYMKVHHAKIPTGQFGAFSLATLEFLENFTPFKISPLVKVLFKLDVRAAALTTPEMTTPGREVAYIARTQDIFGKPPKRAESKANAEKIHKAKVVR
jgi:hypothetical protein